MARLIGYMANRRDRLRDAFRQERDAINGYAGERRAWGIGFYQGDEVLHKKQPTADGEPVDWDNVARDVRTDCAIAHVRHATVGGFSVDNTHPFRFRHWLFAHVGTLALADGQQAKLLESLPDYLRRNIRGHTDSELFLHLILASLHDAGVIETYDPDRGAVLDALREATAKVDAASKEGETSELNCILTNGRQAYALCRGRSFGFVEQTGLRESVEPEGGRPPPGSPLLRYVMLVSADESLPERYTEVQQGEVVIVDRDLNVHRRPLAN